MTGIRFSGIRLTMGARFVPCIPGEGTPIGSKGGLQASLYIFSR